MSDAAASASVARLPSCTMSLRRLDECVKSFPPRVSFDAIVHHGVLDPGIAFLNKPFTSDTLGPKIREVLDR